MRVVRMFSSISYPDGSPFECDTRSLLKKALADAGKAGYSFSFGAEQEFYLFKTDENGRPTKTPYDYAGYMDIAPDDLGENIRREICLTLEQMGIHPESSHHEEGPGQNEIDFRYSDALTTADNTLTFQTVVKTVAHRNGLAADFSAKPLSNKPGNGFHINMSVTPDTNSENLYRMIAGVLEKAEEMTVFLNPTENSYQRFGVSKAPGYVSWSGENRSQLIRIPAAEGEYHRAELRSPDPAANPYLAFTLLIYAGLYGIENKLKLPDAADFNLYKADKKALENFKKLPENLADAKKPPAPVILSRRISPQKSWIFTAANNNRLRNGFSQRKIIGADRKGGRDNLTLKETIYSVLVVSSSEKFNAALPVLLSDIKYSPLHIVSSVNAAKRNLSERAYDYVIINSPLPDDVGAELAIEACDSRETVVLLLARAEYHDEIYIKVSEHGVLLCKSQ